VGYIDDSPEVNLPRATLYYICASARQEPSHFEAVRCGFVPGLFRVRSGFVDGSFGFEERALFLCFVRDGGFVSALPFFGRDGNATGNREGRGAKRIMMRRA
jgi:hypothetical protein